ncbi:hypothetical protein HDZ31DRAFT_66651 [Schizophyllum fasciatum]
MVQDVNNFATVAAAKYQHFIQFCIQWSSITLLYYDYCLTFADERKLIWGRRLGVTTALYFLCRYALVANVLYLLAISHLIDKVRIHSQAVTDMPIHTFRPHCDAAYTGISSLSVLGRTAVLSTWTTRTWVVWERNPAILLFLGSLVAGCTALDCASDAPALQPTKRDKALSIMVVVFEFMSTFLMLIRCFPAVRKQNRMRAGGVFQRPLLVAIFQQGLLYYCAVSLFTVTALILNYAAPKGFFQRLLNAFTLPISGLLTARFILHLRTIAGQDVVRSRAATSEGTEMSRMDFDSRREGDRDGGDEGEEFVSRADEGDAEASYAFRANGSTDEDGVAGGPDEEYAGGVLARSADVSRVDGGANEDGGDGVSTMRRGDDDISRSLSATAGPVNGKGKKRLAPSGPDEA